MARDLIHDAVKAALKKANWEVTHDPFILRLIDDERALEVDLGAEKMLAAKKGKEQILVEIKTFGGTSILNKFHGALGQFLDYKAAIQEANLERTLFLAISETTYLKIKKINFIKRRIAQFQLQLLIVDIENEKIIEWIK